MKQYIDIVKHVLENGKEKSPVRKNHQTGKWEPVDGGVKTLACPNVVFSHNMSEGFPLLTTKKMAWRSIRVELEGFIKGVTSKQWYKDRKCNFWNEWANPQEVDKGLREWSRAMNDCDAYDHFTEEECFNHLVDNEIKKQCQEKLDDLGPVYGYSWRSFDQHYDIDDTNWYDTYKEDPNGVYKGTDQLKNIVDALKNNPMDRRMVCSAWNPNQIHMMALPPCHYSWNVTVIGDELNLFWAQRSCDLLLGVPANIASYGLLLCLLAKVGGFKRGNLSGMLVDCHIYENQIDTAKEQITRDPRTLPNLEIPDNIMEKDDITHFDIFQWEWRDVELTNYNPHPALKKVNVVV